MKVQAKTDVGMVRSDNQDYFFFTPEPVGSLQNLFLVADGMGGHRAGDMASRFTVETFVRLVGSYEYTDTVTILTEAVTRVNALLLEKAGESEDYEGMGTTLVAATIDGNTLKVANVGDSRLYLVGDDICQVTRDHSLVEELLEAGIITREQAQHHPQKNVITRALGSDHEVTADTFEVNLGPGDCLLLCSDGLTNVVPEDEITAVLNDSADSEAACRDLMELALSRGAPDNVTIVVWKR